MLTITQTQIDQASSIRNSIDRTSEFELPFGGVAAACPPVLPVRTWAPLLPQQAWFAAPGEQPAGVQGRTSEFGKPGYAGAVIDVRPVAAIAGGGADLLNRPFHTMSRRDHRTWRPPH